MSVKSKLSILLDDEDELEEEEEEEEEEKSVSIGRRPAMVVLPDEVR